MFATLKRAFQRDRRHRPEHISTTPRIRAIMRQLQTEHELLCVRVSGCEQQANSVVLGLEEQRGIFLMDELNVDDVHQALTRNRRVRIDCRLQGMELRFATDLLDVEDDNGLALYRMALPKHITRIQRREHFRLRMGPGLVVPFTVPDLRGESVKGEVFDLSQGGIGAFLNTRTSPEAGEVLNDVALALPRSRPFKARIEIRFARPNPGRHTVRIGARFIDLDSNRQRQIARFLAEQQRKRRRREPR